MRCSLEEKMVKRYFRSTIAFNRERASEVEEIDVPDDTSEDNVAEIVAEAMWMDIVNNNIDYWSEEITKEEYDREMGN